MRVYLANSFEFHGLAEMVFEPLTSVLSPCSRREVKIANCRNFPSGITGADLSFAN
jgi:hypothetical protein